MSWQLLPAVGFPSHAEQWGAFNRESAASPLLQAEFVQPLIEQFATGKELLAIYKNGARIDAMAIVAPAGAGKWDTFQPSQAPIGMWMERPGSDGAAMRAALLRSLPGLALALGLTQRDPAIEARPEANATTKTVDYILTSHVPISGSFEDFWDARGKNLRSNLKKQRSKLLKDGVVTRLEIIRDPQAVAAAIADYGRLETTGWKSGIGTAVSPDNAQGRFYQHMLENFCRMGCGSILRYWFDDKIVAMNLCIEGFGCMIILKTAYDESLGKQFSPAFLMLEETCQQLFEEKKFERLEFYGRVMEWHTRWTDAVRTMYHLTTYRWPLVLHLQSLLQSRPRPAPPSPVAAEPAGSVSSPE
jgi:hypothetical protein